MHPQLPRPPYPPVATRRLAPVVHFLTPLDAGVEGHLRALALEAHRAGQPLEAVQYALTARALALGYAATVACEEVTARGLPSFSGQEVLTPLLLVDVRPLRPRPVERAPTLR